MKRLFLKREVGEEIELHMENGDKATITICRVDTGPNGGKRRAHLLIEAPPSVGVITTKEDEDERVAAD